MSTARIAAKDLIDESLALLDQADMVRTNEEYAARLTVRAQAVATAAIAVLLEKLIDPEDGDPEIDRRAVRALFEQGRAS